jgi:hypothetical protein
MPLSVRRGAIAALFALLLPAAAGADTKAVYVSSKGKDSMTVRIKGDMIRMDARELARDQRYGLFDSARKTFYLVDDGNKQVMEITPETARQARAQMQQMAPMLKQLREQLKNMPPEQRRMIEKQMGAMSQMTGDGPKTTISMKPAGSGSVQGIPCQRYSMLRNGKPDGAVCLATRADARVPAGDYETMKKMQDMMQDMASSFGSVSMPTTGDIDGVPLEIVNGTTGAVRTLKSLSTDTLPAAQFALPAYKKVDFGGMSGTR